MPKIVKTVQVVLAANSPLLKPTCFKEVAWALKAVNAGEATKDQQSMAMRWIVNKLCATYDLPYRPGAPDDTQLAMGKMFVGLEIARIIKLEPGDIAKLPTIAPASSGESDELPDQ